MELMDSDTTIYSIASFDGMFILLSNIKQNPSLLIFKRTNLKIVRKPIIPFAGHSSCETFSAPTKPEPTIASSSGPIDQGTREDNPAAAAIIGCVSSVMTALSSMISRDSGIDVQA